MTKPHPKGVQFPLIAEALVLALTFLLLNKSLIVVTAVTFHAVLSDCILAHYVSSLGQRRWFVNEPGAA